MQVATPFCTENRSGAEPNAIYGSNFFIPVISGASFSASWTPIEGSFPRRSPSVKCGQIFARRHHERSSRIRIWKDSCITILSWCTLNGPALSQRPPSSFWSVNCFRFSAIYTYSCIARPRNHNEDAEERSFSHIPSTKVPFNFFRARDCPALPGIHYRSSALF